jgi:hypothetical protein
MMSDQLRSNHEGRPIVTLAFQSADLSDERLQENVENLLPQLREVGGIADVGLVPLAEVPENSKAIGAMALGALKFTIDNSKILTGLLGVGNAIVGNSKTVKLTVKAANGEEFSAEAKTVAELEQIQQLAADFLDRRS